MISSLKTTLLLIALSWPTALLAQGDGKDKIALPIDSSTQLVTFQEIVKIDSASKDELYLRAREWFVRTFNSAQSVIQMDDRPSGKIIGKGLSEMSYSVFGQTMLFNLYYTVSITAKDNRYRYEITSFIFDMDSQHNISYVKTSYPIEKVLSENNDDIVNLKMSGKYKKKALEGREIVSGQISKSIQNTGMMLSESIRNAMSNIHSKDDF